jgi:hypothetical protein
MHHIVEFAGTDDHVDGLRLEEVERLAVLPVPLLFHLQNDRVKHTYTIIHHMDSHKQSGEGGTM